MPGFDSKRRELLQPLLDVQGALDALPRLPLTDAPHTQHEVAKATGTDGKRKNLVAPTVAPTSDFSSPNEAFPDNSPSSAGVADSNHRHAENLTIPSEKALFAGFANKASQVGMTGFEPATSTSRT